MKTPARPFAWLTAASVLLACAACEKKPQSSTPPAQAQTKIVSAEPVSFDAVTKHLDPGGGLFFYLSTESFISQVSALEKEVRQIAMSSPSIPQGERAKIEMAWDVAEKLLRGSGLGEVTGFGASSIALEPGFYQTKWMLHHYEGKGDGLLWKLSGTSSTALNIIPWLPAQTAFASSSDIALEPLWAMVNKLAEDKPELKSALQQLTAEFSSKAALDLPKLLASLGPEYAMLLTLDETKQTTIPAGAAPVTIPEPALGIVLRVRDEALIARLDAELSKVPLVTKSEQDGFQLRMIALPLPLPFVRPAVAWKGDLLFIVSNDALLREMMDVKAGKKPGLAATEAFKKVMEGMPQKGTGFSVLSPLFRNTLTQFQMKMAAVQQKEALDPAITKLMEKFAGGKQSHWNVSVMENTPEGWLGISRGDTGQNQVVAATAVAPAALVSAIAVPNFLRARKRSQAARVLEDLRMIDSAIDQYAIETNKKAGDPVKWSDIQAYLKPGTPLYSTGADVFGASYGTAFSVDTPPKVPASTYNALSDVAPPEFWSPYVPAK